MMHDYFALDTSAYELDTAAKNDIWKNHADFSQKTDDMVNAASNLNALVKADKTDDFRKGIGALGATCKACHDDYKKD
jgi:cytochrome c556